MPLKMQWDGQFGMEDTNMQRGLRQAELDWASFGQLYNTLSFPGVVGRVNRGVVGRVDRGVIGGVAQP